MLTFSLDTPFLEAGNLGTNTWHTTKKRPIHVISQTGPISSPHRESRHENEFAHTTRFVPVSKLILMHIADTFKHLECNLLCFCF